MANKNEVYVTARRRLDNVLMVLGRGFIAQYPHLFEEVVKVDAIAHRALDVKIEKVPEPVVEDAEVSMEFNTEKGFTEPETIEEFRTALDLLGVEYKPQHGIPGLMKLYNLYKG